MPGRHPRLGSEGRGAWSAPDGDGQGRSVAVAAWLAERLAALGAVGGVVALVAADAAALEPRWWVGYPEEVIDSWSRIPIDSSTPLTDALRGDPVVVATYRQQTARYPALGTSPTTGCAALAAVAVPGPGGRPVGALGFSFSTPRPGTITSGVLLAAAQDLAALLPAEDGDEWIPDTRPEQHRGQAGRCQIERDRDAVVGPAPDLAVLNEPARRAELARLGLGEGWGEVGEPVHRLTGACHNFRVSHG